MTFTLDQVFELIVGQRIVLQHRILPELVLCEVKEIRKISPIGYHVAVIFLRSVMGTTTPDDCFFLLDTDGRSIEFGRTQPGHPPDLIGCIDYECIGDDIVIPDDLNASDAIDYVIARI